MLFGRDRVGGIDGQCHRPAAGHTGRRRRVQRHGEAERGAGAREEGGHGAGHRQAVGPRGATDRLRVTGQQPRRQRVGHRWPRADREGPAFVARTVTVPAVPGTSDGLDTVTDVSACGASTFTTMSAWLLEGSGSSVSERRVGRPAGQAGAGRRIGGDPYGDREVLLLRPEAPAQRTGHRAGDQAARGGHVGIGRVDEQGAGREAPPR